MPALAPSLALVLLLAAGARSRADEVGDLLSTIEAATLAPDGAVAVEDLRLDLGSAVLKVERGTFFPATPVGGRVVELVFEGRGRLMLEPPDEVEASQLEIFTGGSTLDEEISAAVLVIASDATVEAILRRPVVTPDPAATARAEDLYASWKTGPVRKLLNVDGAMLQDGLGDPFYQGYFAGWFEGEALGEFLYLIEPDSREQITLGQFVPADLSEKEQKRAERVLHKEQSRGRLTGVEVEDLGAWDTWISAPLISPDGTPVPRSTGFEPQRYVLEVTLSGRHLELAGRALLHLKAMAGNTRVVRLTLHGDLAVSEVRGAGDRALPFYQAGAEVLAILPEVPARGESTVLDVVYGGIIGEKVRGAFHLDETVYWHPHAGEADRAAYEVTLRWPRRLELAASGLRVAAGEEAGGMKWERRVLATPSRAFGFEVGKFATTEHQVGHVTVHLALTPATRRLWEGLIWHTVERALTYFEEVFGPYPSDQLTVVSTPRIYSQSQPGLITLSRWMMGEWPWPADLLGLPDRRTIIAHEVAHQWWGHAVGWESYRDQWISEAMANYAANLYARNRLGGVDHRYRPTGGWEEALTASLPDGRPVESLGPLVLGQRLISSRSDDAYVSIVYKKGALVLDMLARNFGEDTFLALLRRVIEEVSPGTISTGDFFTLLDRLSGQDLDAFARQFVFATGLPEAYYDYRFEETAEGTWRVTVTARQQSPYHYRYRLVELPGGLDVARERIDHLEVERSSLVVPLQVALYDPTVKAEDDPREGAPDLREASNSLLSGRLWLNGEHTEIAFEVRFEPKELWLDLGKEVFGRFFNRRRHPKRVLFLRCLDQAADGQATEAERTCREALAAPVVAGPALADSAEGEAVEQEGRLLDGRIHAHLARLDLDGGRTAEARAGLKRAWRLLEPRRNSWYRGDLTILEARLAIREGDFDRAYKLLRKGVIKREETGSTEALLLLAIAARATGHGDDLEYALEQAKDQGADVSLLSAP